MKRVSVADMKSPGHASDQKVLYFSNGIGGVRDKTRVYFGVEKASDVSETLVDTKTKIASDFLDAQAASEKRTGGLRYEIRNGQMFEMP